MRVLLIGSRKTWRMEAAVQRAMRRLGHTTRLIDDRKAARTIGRPLTQKWALWHNARFKPDFVFLSKCHGLEPETVARIVRDVPNAMWYHDSAYYGHTERPDIKHIVSIGKLAHTFWVTGFEWEWRAHGLEARFLPAAGDRNIVPVRPDPAFASDVAFIGTGYAPERAQFLVEIAKRYKLRVWGTGWEQWREQLNWTGRAVERRDFAAVCSSSGITLGVNPSLLRGATTCASDRMWMVMLGGGFYLGEGTPGIDRMLLDDVHCAWYTDVDSALTRIEHYLGHDAERERIRAAGEKFVREHHTYDERTRHIFSGEEWTNPLGS
jgi:hypothetical protein